jgi:hypothetical protein
MALPILDGNQSATTLSTILSGGEHTPAHTVVSLGSAAISNITSAVSGSVVSVSNFPLSQAVTFTQASVTFSSVSISNFPTTQTISGTVTANVGGIANGVTIPVRLFAEAEGGAASGQDTLLICDSTGQLLVNMKSSGSSVLGYDGNAFVQVKQVSGSSITVGSLPAISGTVTANVFNATISYVSAVLDGDGNTFGIDRDFPISGTVTASGIFDPNNSPTSVVADDGAQRCSYGIQIGYNNTQDDQFRLVASDSGLPISGTVTVGAVPNGSLTTRFGTPATASVAFATTAVTNANRKYLLIQNVTTGSNVITVGIGFTPTTTQGIQLVAGAGITFESSYIPTGAVYVLSSVTASNFTVLEA